MKPLNGSEFKPEKPAEPDKPEEILVHIERIIVALSLANLSSKNLVYMLTHAQWEELLNHFRKNFSPGLKSPGEVAFVHYKGVTIMPPRTPPV